MDARFDFFKKRETVVPTPANAEVLLSDYKGLVVQMVHKARELRVVDAADIPLAVEMAGQARRLAKEIDGRRKEILAEATALTRKVNAFAKEFTEPLADAQEILKTKLAPVFEDTEVKTQGAYLRRQWKFGVRDADSVPHEYCSPDSKKIREAIKAGVRKIPGVEIFEDLQIVLTKTKEG